MKFALAITLLAVAASAANIPTVATDNGSFGTLVAALGAAGLVDALSGEGPFTVFAPTDDAFKALPEALVTCLLLPDNKDALTSILTYHVANGSVQSTDLTDGQEIPTLLEGSSVVITLGDDTKVNDSTVIIADVAADNGVIHAIDAVLVPPSVNVTAFLESCPEPEPVVEPTAGADLTEVSDETTDAIDNMTASDDNDATAGDEMTEAPGDENDESGAALLSASAAMIVAGLVTAFL